MPTSGRASSSRAQAQIPGLDYQDGRAFDLYVSLVGELFDLLRDEPEDARDWATLGNAFAQAARGLDGSARLDATFFSAASVLQRRVLRLGVHRYAACARK